jgi:hypothetical protein
MIEKILHLAWFAPNEAVREMPSDVQKAVAAWRQLEPNIEIKVWTETDLEKALSNLKGGNAWKAISSCRLPAMKADISALALVYEFGGFWSGFKNLPLMPFLEDLSELHGFVVAEHFPLPSRPDPVHYLCNAFFGAARGNDFAGGCLDVVIENVLGRKQGSAMAVTGGGMLNQVRDQWQRLGASTDLVVLNYEEFWGGLLKRVPASYDKDGMHWSKRQKTEPLYA